MPDPPRPGRPRELDDATTHQLTLDAATRETLDRVVAEHGLTPRGNGHGWGAAIRWLAEEWGRSRAGGGRKSRRDRT